MGVEKYNAQVDAVQEQKPKISDESFKDKFVKQSVESEGYTYEFTKVEPEEGEAISDQWVVFLGGFGAGAKEYRAEIKDLVLSGRKVMFLNPLEGVDVDPDDAEIFDSFDIPETLQKKTSEVLRALDSMKETRVDIIGHSQGAIIGSLVASLRPGIAEDLILNNPAGMHGEDTSVKLVGRTLKGLAEQQVENAKRVATEKGELGRIWGPRGVMQSVATGAELHKKPLYRAKDEVPSIVATNIIPVLKSLQEFQERLGMEDRTKVTLVTSNKDRMFAPSKIEENAGLEREYKEPEEVAMGVMSDPEFVYTEESMNELYKVVDSYVSYVDKDAGHEASIYEKSGNTAQLVNEKFQGQDRIPKFSTAHNASNIDAEPKRKAV